MTFDWRKRYGEKLRSPDEAVKAVRSGDVVVFNLGDSLTHSRALARRRGELRDVRVRHVGAQQPHPWYVERMDEAFLFESGFAGVANREALERGWGDYVPWPFGLSHRQFEDDRWGFWAKPDVFMTKVSPPNERGYCSFGHMCWAGPIARRKARTIIAEVNEGLPHTYGDNSIHVDEIAFLTEPDPADVVSGAPAPPPPDEVDAVAAVGALAASLIRDGDTFQIGTGTASQATMDFLGDKNDLGVHTELIFPQIIDMERAGQVSGRFKTHRPGKLVTTSVVVPPADPAAAEPYLRHVDMNERYEFYDIGYICHVPRIARQFRMVAVNNALSIDLTGQTMLDVLNTKAMSGVGGGLEFILGANYSKGGRGVTVLLSTARGGSVSRIVPRFPEGAVVSLPRGVVDYVVTEWGIVNIQGLSLRDRAAAIISIAHPTFRDELRSAADGMYGARRVIV